MDTRSTAATVTFAHPFSVEGLDRVWPAGIYTVVTDEEQLDASFSAYRRTATRIILTSGGLTQSWVIEPADLAAALTNDDMAN